MGKVELDIPGKPIGKARPRVTRRGITYTPKTTADREKLVRQIYAAKYPDRDPFTCPLRVAMTAVYPVPVSAPAGRRRDMMRGCILPTSRPDLDNVAKLILDALNGLAYEDDSRVCLLDISKRYAREGEEPHTSVIISEIAADEMHSEMG